METKTSKISSSPSLVQNDNSQSGVEKAKVIAAMIQESQAWLELPWVQEKLKERWDRIYTLDYPPFEL